MVFFGLNILQVKIGLELVYGFWGTNMFSFLILSPCSEGIQSACAASSVNAVSALSVTMSCCECYFLLRCVWNSAPKSS